MSTTETVRACPPHLRKSQSASGVGGHLARTMAKNSNHARFYKTTAHVDFFNLYGGEPTDEEVISRVREMAEPSN